MQDTLWWRDGIIYQIYPRSFYDTNADGLGDLPGITAKLDYIAGLGVDAIWLSPFYPSPDQDFGYDITDHCAVDPRFGTLQDFDDLLAAAHARGLKVILDLVLNHTSDQHPWFQQSRLSRDNPYRAWYIWADPSPRGKPPNNWQAAPGGSAWEFDPLTGQYYLHMFIRQQPDVNWRNPNVRQAQLDVVRFWLRRGVDGFRLDLFNAYFKDAQLRSNPALPIPIPLIGMKHVHDLDQPAMLPLLNELRAILDEAPGRCAVGETLFPTPQKAARYVGADLLHAAFSFELTGTAGFGAGWGPTWVRARLEEREAAFQSAGAWPTTVLGNHDVPRPASRCCRGEDDGPAKVAMALLLTARGTPFIYYGDEIGMRNHKLRREQILDPLGKLYYPIFKGRDGCRAPMQWDGSPQGGFSSAAPWLPVHPNYLTRNVEQQSHDPNSLYNFTRSLIRLRKQTPALQRGEMAFVDAGTRQVLAYTRTLENTTVLALLNFTGRPARVSLPVGFSWQVLFSTHRTQLPANPQPLHLEAHEVCLRIAE